MLTSLIALAFAGIWTFIWQWGVCIALIIMLLAAAYFTTAIPILGRYLDGMRNHLLWAAFVIAVFLYGHSVGTKAANQRTAARAVVIEVTVEKAVEKAKTKSNPAKDRWNRPEY
jgi:hypothetical protein